MSSRCSESWLERRFRLGGRSDDDLADDDWERLELVDSVEFAVRLAAVRLVVREFDSADVDSSSSLPRPIRLFSRPMVPSVLVPF